jgi:hypothetical protein
MRKLILMAVGGYAWRWLQRRMRDRQGSNGRVTPSDNRRP